LTSKPPRCRFFCEQAESRLFFAVIAGIAFLADRFSKIAVMGALREEEGLPILNGFLHLTRVNNTGAAFGLFKGNAVFLAIICVVFLAVLFLGRRKSAPDIKSFVGFALLAGGALGNLADRILYGHVIDFIDFRVWPVFNVADICICSGVILVLWVEWRASRKRS